MSAIESRTNHHLSTLARYVSAMGGELRLQAVFPEATFNLDIKAGLAKAKVRSNAVQTKVMKPAVQGKTMATRPVKRVLRRAA